MNEHQATSKLKSKLDPKFLEQLSEVARLYGWEGDYVEIRKFVEDLHYYGEKPCPDLEPYDTT